MSLTTYSLAVLALAAGLISAVWAEKSVQVTELPPLEKPVTSFGAAVAGDYLYVYGGHLGSPHEYSAELQSRDLLRLHLKQPQKWERVGDVPRRTGLAMVAYGGKLYRICGWEARPGADGKSELFS